jgi:uncharacterized membrane-anchored protein
MTVLATSIWPRIAAVVGLQTAVLGYMVVDRISLLRSGTEITLDVVPVDPRSLFRGDYVILNYPMSRLDPAIVEPNARGAKRLYVTLAKEPDGTWKAVAASGTRPAVTSGADRIVIAARPQHRGPMNGNGPLFVRYGIESYFVPEGTGRAIEKAVGEKRVRVLVRIGSDGEAAVAGLTVDGKLVHHEPVL